MLCVRCLAMGFHPSKARLDGQFLLVQPSGPRGPLQSRGKVRRRLTRKSFAEGDAVMVALAKKLRRYPVNGRKRSLRDIAVALEAQGYLNERGKLFNPKSIRVDA